MKISIKLLFIIFMISLVPLNRDIEAQSINSSLHYELQQIQSFPILKNLNQISNNQIEITFDTSVNSFYAIQPCNYWIQNLNEDSFDQISSLNKNDKITNQNCLNSNMVKIEPKESSNKTFIITFKKHIISNKKYKLIICHVPSPNNSTFNGRNGAITFIGK